MREYEFMDRFLDGLADDIYPEPVAEPHATITRTRIDHYSQTGRLRPGHLVFDVGCGQGLAQPHFAAAGARWVGITLGPDAASCRSQGLAIIEADQSFLQHAEQADWIWARHVLEHSPFPYFTLTEYARHLKPAGLAYVEVPQADTSCHHERNPNHYSLFPASMWASLFARARFAVIEHNDIAFETPAGRDVYSSFLLEKLTPVRQVSAPDIHSGSLTHE